MSLENAVTERKCVLVEAAAFPTDDRVTYKDSTYEIVSKVAYLIGVRNAFLIMSMKHPR